MTSSENLTNGNFVSRFWTQNTRRTIGRVQALPPPLRPTPRERAVRRLMEHGLSMEDKLANGAFGCARHYG